MVRTSPSHAARALATDLGADLAVGGTETESALVRFLEGQPVPPPPDLDELAAAMRRAESIRERTREAAAERLTTSFNTKLAIHPETIRRAAGALIGAREELVETERRIARRRLRRRVSVSLVALAAAAGVAIVAILVDPVIGAIAGGGAVAVGAIAWLIRRVWRRRRPTPDLRRPAQQAIELAERRWLQLTGADADPTDIEALIRRYEPQHKLILGLVTESPAVRAADQVAIERRAAWVAAWRAAVGDKAPLADPLLAKVLQRDDTEIWLDTAGVPKAGPPTLVVADPFAGLDEDHARALHTRLSELPRDHRVIVVLEPDPEHPSGARLPAFGRVEASSSS